MCWHPSSIFTSLRSDIFFGSDTLPIQFLLSSSGPIVAEMTALAAELQYVSENLAKMTAARAQDAQAASEQSNSNSKNSNIDKAG